MVLLCQPGRLIQERILLSHLPSRSQESEELIDHISPLWLTTEEHVASLRHPFHWLHVPRAEAPRQCSPASVPWKDTLASSTKEMLSHLLFRDWRWALALISNCHWAPVTLGLYLLLLFTYSLSAVLGLCCCTRAFSSWASRSYSIVVQGLLIAVCSLVVEHRL